MSISKWIMAVLAIGMFIFLCSLGNWQMQRLQWKEALLAQVEERRTAAPVPIQRIVDLWENGNEVDYRAVTLSGTYDHAQEVYYYNTLDGTVGWNVLTPMKMSDGRDVIVNRGFVPDAFRQPDKRIQGQVTGTQSVVGLARTPPNEKPNSFMPENDIAKNSFFWKDHPAMVARMKLQEANVLPFFVDAGKSPQPNIYPIGGTTRISFPNNHLQYAATWYGLAAALVMVVGFFLWSNRKSEAGSNA